MTAKDFQNGKEIVEKCLTIEENEIKNYIQDSLNFYIKRLNLNINKLDDRNMIYQFLNHQSTLFSNFQINPEIYLLGEKEVKKAEFGKLIIKDICFQYRKCGLNT